MGFETRVSGTHFVRNLNGLREFSIFRNGQCESNSVSGMFYKSTSLCEILCLERRYKKI